MDQQRNFKKIKDVNNFDPLRTTSTFEVKTNQSPPGSGVMHDAFAKIIREFLEIHIIDKFNGHMDSYKKREEKKIEFPIFLMITQVASRPQYGMTFGFFGRQPSYASSN